MMIESVVAAIEPTYSCIWQSSRGQVKRQKYPAAVLKLVEKALPAAHSFERVTNYNNTPAPVGKCCKTLLQCHTCKAQFYCPTCERDFACPGCKQLTACPNR